MKPECNNCGFVRRVMILVLVIAVVVMVFYKLEFSKIIYNTNATGAASNLLFKNETVAKPTTVTLKTKDIESASVIEYMFVKPEIVGADRVAVLITPKSDWQGDYTPVSIAATLVDAFNKWSAKNKKAATSHVVIVFYPTPKANDSMLGEAALGRLEHDMSSPQAERELFVVKRGYLPQEVKYISLRTSLIPSYFKNGTIDKNALNAATAEKLGPEGYGMDYPFQPLLRVEEEK